MPVEVIVGAILTAGLSILGFLHTQALGRITGLKQDIDALTRRVTEHHEKDHVALALAMGKIEAHIGRCERDDK